MITSSQVIKPVKKIRKIRIHPKNLLPCPGKNGYNPYPKETGYYPYSNPGIADTDMDIGVSVSEII